MRIANDVFSRVRKWYVQSKATEVCEFRAKIPPFIGACSLHRLRFLVRFLIRQQLVRNYRT